MLTTQTNIKHSYAHMLPWRHGGASHINRISHSERYKEKGTDRERESERRGEKQDYIFME